MNENSGKDKSFKRLLKKITFKNILKFIAAMIILSVYVLIFGRIYLADNHGVMNRFSFDEATVSEYTKDTEFMTQTLNKTMDKNGFYKISNFVYIPSSGELQINVRYNNSTLDALNTLYPDNHMDSEPFVFILSDGNGNNITKYQYISDKNLIYNFRKLRFDSLDFENTDVLYLTVMPSVDIDKESEMAVTFEIFNKAQSSYKSKLKVRFDSKFDRFTESSNFVIS